MAKCILVIDDDPQTRALVAALLQPAGYTVREAPDGVRGIEAADAAPPDLVLLDVQMPGMDGYEVCRQLRQAPCTRQVPVVMLTATDDVALNRKAYAAGAHACIPKPFRGEGLVAVIKAALSAVSRGQPKASA